MSPSDIALLLAQEKGTTGPASAQLQEALGINPEDLSNAVGESGATPLLRQRSVEAASDRAKLHERAMRAASSEPVETREAMFTVIATYVANRPSSWWYEPRHWREEEIDFLSSALIRANDFLGRHT